MSGSEVPDADLARVALPAAMRAARKNGGGPEQDRLFQLTR
ncbi:hypothetical protein [Streptomyces sp. NPDC085596]